VQTFGNKEENKKQKELAIIEMNKREATTKITTTKFWQEDMEAQGRNLAEEFEKKEFVEESFNSIQFEGQGSTGQERTKSDQTIQAQEIKKQ